MDLEAYRTLSHPAAFSGVGGASRYFEGASEKSVRDSLTRSDAYTRTREVKPPDYNYTFVNNLRELLEVDLMDMTQLSSRNRGIAYYLVVIDVFSKRVFIAGMKRKTAAAAREAFETILSEMPMSDRIARVHLDDGNEWKGPFAQLLRERGIEKKVASRHASTVERVQRSLKSLIARYMTEYETVNHTDVIGRVLDTYNNRFHRTIQTSPMLADLPENVAGVRYAVEVGRRDKLDRQYRKEPKFAVGDIVRVQLSRNTWQRSFQPTFGTRFYKVARVHRSLPEPMYTVQKVGPNEREESRRRYATELQKVNLDAFKISKVHWRKKRRHPNTGREQVLVNWQGLPEEEAYASYVDVDSIAGRVRAYGRLWR